MAIDPLRAARRLADAALAEVPAAHWLPRPLKVRVFDAVLALARRLPCHVLRLRPTPAFFPEVARALALDGA
jgi:hypothetical protein